MPTVRQTGVGITIIVAAGNILVKVLWMLDGFLAGVLANGAIAGMLIGYILPAWLDKPPYLED